MRHHTKPGGEHMYTVKYLTRTGSEGRELHDSAIEAEEAAKALMRNRLIASVQINKDCTQYGGTQVCVAVYTRQ